MPEITFQRIDGWWYVRVNGRRDRYGYSTVAGAFRRYHSILEGWI